MTKELKNFEINNAWREGGALIEIAHPDDEILIAWGAIHSLLEVGIPITVLTLTLGELGETKDKPDIYPEEMGRLRHSEFLSLTGALGIKAEKKDFPDTELSAPQILEQAKKVVLGFVRENKFGVIFSFHPNEVTPEFDHPDHNAAGEIARYAGAFSAVKNKITDTPPVSKRPELYLWTSNPELATHHILLTRNLEQSRKKHLADYYPSQFTGNAMGKWGVIFDGITRGMNGNLPAQEMFMKIR